jgi:hypothetical protein
LSGGVFGTPQVLELSGVGNPKVDIALLHLEISFIIEGLQVMNPLGISTVVDLPVVGENLSDRMSILDGKCSTRSFNPPEPSSKYVATLATGGCHFVSISVNS